MLSGCRDQFVDCLFVILQAIINLLLPVPFFTFVLPTATLLWVLPAALVSVVSCRLDLTSVWFVPAHQLLLLRLPVS